jgi:hypothetical protein
MARPKKEKQEVAQMAQEPIDSLAEIVEHKEDEQPEQETVVEEEMAKIYIPDIPAQIIVQEPKQETEIQFLYKILQIQENGGFGRHLDRLILDRIKSLS